MDSGPEFEVKNIALAQQGRRRPGQLPGAHAHRGTGQDGSGDRCARRRALHVSGGFCPHPLREGRRAD